MLEAALIITVALYVAYERGKKEYAHTRDKAATELSRAHPEWSPRKVMRHARRRARGYWMDQIANGFPEYRRAHAETRELAKAERVEAEVGWMKRRAELQKRVDDAQREKERLKRGDSGEIPAPITAGATPENKTATPVPVAPAGQSPEPVKAAPGSVIHDNDNTYAVNPKGKEDARYQRYAMRRRNGGQPMTPLAIADEFGVPLAEGEKLKTEWETRYARETADPDQPPQHLLDFQKHSRCHDCGGEIELEKDPKRPGWIVRTTHKDENCPNNSQRPTPRQEHDQKVAELADAAKTTNPTSTTAPINGMENPLTANAETTGLQSALNYTSAMADTCGEGSTSVETSIAALQQGEVGESVTGHLTQAQDHLAAAQAAFKAANDELNQQVNVREAYNATPDAGNKQFVTAD